MSGKHLSAYFQDIVVPNRQAFLGAPTEANLWNYAVALHHMVDYEVADNAKDPLDRAAHTATAAEIRDGRDDLKCLTRVADAFKHRRKLEKLFNAKVIVATTSAGAVFSPFISKAKGSDEDLEPKLRVLADPRDTDLVWRTTVDGNTVELNKLLEQVFTYWTSRIKP